MRTLCLLSLLLLPLAAFAQKKPDKKPDPSTLMEKRTFKKDKHALLYRLFVPTGYKADGKNSYPLVVFLHGAGERGEDNTAQLKHGVADFVKPENQKKHACFVIAPQCPKDQGWIYRASKKKETKKPEVEAGELVLDLIEALRKEYRIDDKRIYLTGLSMGGYGTWALLARKPELFAAGIPICGGGDVKKADVLAKTPIWCFHGDKDKSVPVERSREMIAAIEKAGGKPKYTQYEGVAHDSWTQTYRDPAVHEWLFAQKKE